MRYAGTAVRIRIRKVSGGILRGVSLSHFLPGLSYDVDASLGAYLVSNGAAEEVKALTPALLIPLDEASRSPVYGGITVAPMRDRAAEKPRLKATARRPRKRRK